MSSKFFYFNLVRVHSGIERNEIANYEYLAKEAANNSDHDTQFLQ